jgi:N-acylglucosamine 2-epimerase
MIASNLIEQQKARFNNELYNVVLPFWMNHSLDREHGGYFNCLDRDGSVYDTTKHLWLQGRQVWMLSKIHNAHHKPGEESQWLEAATLGAKFLREHGRKDNRVFFSLTREGGPHFMQRKMFSECFYIMALAEYARASGDESARQEAREMMVHVIEYAKNPSVLGRPSYSNLPPSHGMAVPMILLNLIEEVNDPGENGYEELAKWCIDRMHWHIHPELKLVVEQVGDNGQLYDTPEGRLINPGHAIEAGWFLLDYANRNNNEALVKTSLNMIDWSFDFGWDEDNGGLYYFLDREGYSPIQLEWNMKLWWPHCEAMVAYLMAYQITKDTRYWDKFTFVTNYSFKNFSDPEHGEWYGYLDRENRMSQRFKGGPYKGCFHVPRALFLCDKMLGELSQ